MGRDVLQVPFRPAPAPLFRPRRAWQVQTPKFLSGFPQRLRRDPTALPRKQSRLLRHVLPTKLDGTATLMDIGTRFSTTTGTSTTCKSQVMRSQRRHDNEQGKAGAYLLYHAIDGHLRRGGGPNQHAFHTKDTALGAELLVRSGSNESLQILSYRNRLSAATRQRHLHCDDLLDGHLYHLLHRHLRPGQKMEPLKYEVRVPSLGTTRASQGRCSEG